MDERKNILLYGKSESGRGTILSLVYPPEQSLLHTFCPLGNLLGHSLMLLAFVVANVMSVHLSYPLLLAV